MGLLPAAQAFAWCEKSAKSWVGSPSGHALSPVFLIYFQRRPMEWRCKGGWAPLCLGPPDPKAGAKVHVQLFCF